ncbi:MAG: hypothetical protein ACK4NS_04760 [Saprospiraceae bacterium]
MNSLQKKLLLVESNPQFRSLLAAFFSRYFTVGVARTDIEAWHMLRLGFEANAMLVGLSSASIDMRVLERLRRNVLFADIPIILLSDQPEALAKNSNVTWEIYGKPLDLLQLNSRLKEIA